MKCLKKFMPLILALTLVLSQATSALACTGVYVGSEVSANGSTYIGRSEDISDLYSKIFGIAESKNIADGELYKDTYGFVMDYDAIDFDYPKTTYKYTYVKDSPNYGETMKDENGNPVGEAYAEIGQNEKGLAMTATVSTKYNNSAKAADKLVRTGICEVSMTSLVLAGAETAREGVELLGAIIDKYGAGECNSIMLCDPNEAWYMEIVSGHQYAAIKLPKDKVSVQPNLMLLGAIDVTDTENVIVSENLVKLAQDNGFLVTDENGNINVTKTYGNANLTNNTRYWQGLYYVNGALAETMAQAQDDGEPLELSLLLDPDHKLTTFEILRLLGYRGQGTPYDTDANGLSTAIGNNKQTECHILETRANMPTPLATLQWQAMADAEFSIYLPYYTGLITDVHEGYNNDTTKGRGEQVTSDEFLAKVKDSINWNFQIINNLCSSNRATCAENVKAFFETWQKSIIKQQVAIDAEMVKIYAYDKDLAAQKATELGKDLAQQTLDMTNSVLEELVAFTKSGSTEKFVPSAMVNNVMPVYSFDNIGGTGLPIYEQTADENVVLIPLENVTVNENSVEVPVDVFKEVKDLGKDLIIETPVAEVLLDNATLKAVADKATGQTIVVEISKINKSDLSKEQQNALKDKNVEMIISAEIICKESNKVISDDFGSGVVTVKLPFEPKAGEKGEDYTVVYIGEDGKLTIVETEYKDGYLVFDAEHFSEYLVAKTFEVSNPVNNDVPETGDTSNLMLYVVLAMIAAGMAIVLKKKAE